MKWALTALATLAGLTTLFLLLGRYELHALLHSGIYRILLLVLTAALFSNFLSIALKRFIKTYPVWNPSA